MLVPHLGAALLQVPQRSKEVINPPQVVLSVGFWNGGGELLVMTDLEGKILPTPHSSFHAPGDEGLADYVKGRKDLPKDLLTNNAYRGLMRMRPSFQLIGKHAAMMWGEISLRKRVDYKRLSGERILSNKKVLTELGVKVDFEATKAGGGMVALNENRWDLRPLGIKNGERFMISFNQAAREPWAIWLDKQRPDTSLGMFKMRPRILAEVSRTVVLTQSGKKKTVEQLTGWMVGSGEFHLK